MPANAPYPGESDEEFMMRMAMQRGGGVAPSPYAAGPGMGPVPDPRIAAMDRVPWQGMNTRPPGETPIEEELSAGGGGGDAWYADMYGAGYDSYANGLPGSEGPPTRTQMRNRMVMNPGVPEDEIEQEHMLAMDDLNNEIDEESQEPRYNQYGGRNRRDNPDRGDVIPNRSEEDIENDFNEDGDRLDEEMMEKVQGGIQQKMGEGQRGSDSGATLTGNEEEDKNYILSLIEDGEDASGLQDEFEARYGYYPEL